MMLLFGKDLPGRWYKPHIGSLAGRVRHGVRSAKWKPLKTVPYPHPRQDRK